MRDTPAGLATCGHAGGPHRPALEDISGLPHGSELRRAGEEACGQRKTQVLTCTAWRALASWISEKSGLVLGP